LMAFEQVLVRLAADPDAASPVDLLVVLVDAIRPRHADDVPAARSNLLAVCETLHENAELARVVREAVIAVISQCRHTDIYTSIGIHPNTGFFTELFRRLGHKILPEELDDDLLRSVMRQVFHKPSDAEWVVGVGENAWLQFLSVLRFETQNASQTMPQAIVDMLRALRVLSYWIAAAGMEPELLRLEPALETYESPFVTQNEELLAYIQAYPLAWGKPESLACDEKHLLVLLDQCVGMIERMRKRAAREGTSIRLTYHMQRLTQLIARCELLLEILDRLMHRPDGETAMPSIVGLFTHLVEEECRRDDLRQHWRHNTELIALRITEHVGHDGEHFITETRREYLQLAGAAAIGGLVIGVMACIKLLLGKLGMAPLVEALAYCLNYGVGFCIIHVLHGTVATKQPAMMANTIAGTISQSGGRVSDLQALTALIARTTRSQLVAILGNILVAVPVAAGLSWGFQRFVALPLAGPDKATHLLGEQSLIYSGSLFYGALCGVCLFLAGLISGYFDNYAVYNRFSRRLRHLRWLRFLVGRKRLDRVASYVGDNLGALAGNLAFGFLLGGATVFGTLWGLPVDTRHVGGTGGYRRRAGFGTAVVGSAWRGGDRILQSCRQLCSGTQRCPARSPGFRHGLAQARPSSFGPSVSPAGGFRLAARKISRRRYPLIRPAHVRICYDARRKVIFTLTCCLQVGNTCRQPEIPRFQ